MTEGRYEQFEAYLRGTLNERQEKDLEQALLDPEVKAAFNTYRSVRQVIGQRWQRQADTDAFIRSLQEQNQQYLSPKSSPKRYLSVRRMVLLAACVLLVLGISFVGVRKQQYGDQQLIKHYVTAYQTGAERGSQGLNQYHQALMAYQNEQWAAAADAFANVPATDENYAGAQLFAGYAYLYDGAYSAAKKALQNALQYGTGIQQQNAEWHMVLAEVPATPAGQLPPTLVTILADEDHAFYDQGKALARDLTSIWR